MKKSELKLLVREEIARLDEAPVKWRVKDGEYTAKAPGADMRIYSLNDREWTLNINGKNTTKGALKVVMGAANDHVNAESKRGKVLAALVKGGFNEKDAMAKVDKHLDYAVRVYPNANPAQLAKVIASLHESIVNEDGEGPTKAFNGVAGKYQDLLKQKQDAIKAMKDFLGREKDPGKRAAEIKRYNSAMAKLNAKIAEHERRFTKAMLSIKDVDGEDELL